MVTETADQWRDVMRSCDAAGVVACRKYAIGKMTMDDLLNVLTFNARLWTSAANHIARIRYVEDDVAPTVF